MKILITSSYFTDDQKQGVEEHLRVLFKQLENSIDLSSLEYFIVPDDFKQEVEEFQSLKDKNIGFTKNEHGTAMAKVIDYVTEEGFFSSVFVHYALIAGLYHSETAQFSLHTIHHELCHVHDNFIVYNSLGSKDLHESFKDGNNPAAILSFSFAEIIWSEYIATRLSASSSHIDNDFRVGDLLSSVPLVYHNCRNAISEYYMDEDISKLNSVIQDETGTLAKLMGYFYGDLHGVIQSDDLPKELQQLIEDNQYLNEVFLDVGTELHVLFKEYGDWADHTVFQNLADLQVRLWNQIGISYENRNHELYLKVL